MSKNSNEPQNYNLALERLRSGDVVAIPTETVYGLGADITSSKGIDKIFSTKERPFFDPLIVHVESIEQAKTVAAKFPPLAEKLAQKFWPGPLTLILPKKADLNPKITSGLDTVGVRVPQHAMTLRLLRDLGHPIAAPSANKFGHTSPTTAQHVRDEFNNQVTVLDGGPCSVGVESTVIGFNEDFNEIHIYRPGAITQEMLRSFAPTKLAQSPAAPGQLKHHYMPKKPLVVLSSIESLTPELYEQLEAQLNQRPLYPSWMQLPADPVMASRLLYTNMRNAAEAPGTNCILLTFNLKSEATDLGAALSDRLEKAAKIVI